jgi:hypothetical protein
MYTAAGSSAHIREIHTGDGVLDLFRRLFILFSAFEQVDDEHYYYY